MTRLGLWHAPSPPSRRGRYSADGRSWCDELRQRDYPLLNGTDTLEIELEEAGGHSVLGKLVVALTAQQGQVYYRFMGRAHSADARWPEYIVVGGPFAASRAFLSTPVPPKETWAPEVRARLKELRRELKAAGWLLAGHGEYPWSYRYTRPWVELER